MKDYGRLVPAYVEGHFEWPDRATRWSACHPIKFGALAIVFWAIAFGVLATAASC